MGLALHSMIKLIGGRRSVRSRTSQVMFVVWLEQSLVLMLIGGSGAPGKEK